MITSTLSLFYQLTQKEIFPPGITELERKERWIKAVQKTVEADHKPKYIKVVYTIHDPDIEKQLRFFNGTCIKYYAIQNENMIFGNPDSHMLKKYRETILDEMLGYDLELVGRTVRRRKSTKDFKTVQAWNKFLNILKETIFDSAGFEFPDSKEFWELVKAHGYEQAERISIERLQDNLKKRQ